VQAVNPWLYYTLAILLIGGGVLCWLSNLFSLPGNWVLLGLVALFALLVPEENVRGVSWTAVGILAALAVLGEIVEFVAGAAGAAKRGASRRAILFSLIGAIAGSVLGATAGVPIPVIGSMIGALVGGSAGAFAGAYLGELWSERPHASGMAVGKAAFIGRLWGTVGKFAIGAAMLGVLTVDALFV
jgi:uncharacterized protein YqgC (DUF456 family)